jgi:hypothetical protein
MSIASDIQAQHPITPPLELVQQWWTDAKTLESDNSREIRFIANAAARWGADQELEACCELLNCELGTGWGHGTKLRAAHRPKPPSLKEQALALLDPSNTYGSITQEDEYRISVTKAEIIRRALEQLDD